MSRRVNYLVTGCYFRPVTGHECGGERGSMMDFHKKDKEIDKVFELFFRSWLRGNHEQGNKLLAAYGERRYRAGVEAAAQIVEGWHIKKGGYIELAHQIRARLLAPKEEA